MDESDFTSREMFYCNQITFSDSDLCKYPGARQKEGLTGTADHFLNFVQKTYKSESYFERNIQNYGDSVIIVLIPGPE